MKDFWNNMDWNSKYYGRTPYTKSLEIQEKCFQEILQNPNLIHVLGFEYEPVITLGRRANPEEDILMNTNIPIEFVERGGQATLHSPGQIVIYPLCNIRVLSRNSVKLWVDILLNTTIHSITASSDLKIQHLRKVYSGVYLEDQKIASLGLRVKKNISTFGLAINLNNDTSLFQTIRPCGISQQKVGKIGFEGSLEAFFHSWSESFLMVLRDIDKGSVLLQVEDSRF